MITEEARGNQETPKDGEQKELDYSRPFRLFDEEGLGIIPVDQFRKMLCRLRVNALLRERQVVALINRFDINRTGEFSEELVNVRACGCHLKEMSIKM